MSLYIILLAFLCTCNAFYDGQPDKSRTEIDNYKGLPEIVATLAGNNRNVFQSYGKRRNYHYNLKNKVNCMPYSN